VGVVVSGQTAELAPADGKLYALRDVTGTVPSLPLIASSIMSKKIAAGADAIVLDVKVGRGAFMKTLEEARGLARIMVQIGQGAGRRVSAVISDMNQPLGNAVGNALETAEAVATLRGQGPDDFLEHCLVVAEQMLVLGNLASGTEEAREMVLAALESRKALGKLMAWVEAQGGDASVLSDPPQMMERAPLIRPVLAPRSGVIAAVNAMQVGLCAVELGAGRKKKGEPVDHAVGIVLRAKVGTTVRSGGELCLIHTRDESDFEAARTQMLGAFAWADQDVKPLPLVYEVIDQHSLAGTGGLPSA
jgi:pyrimidine-nucleoside phosphorylase